MQRSVPNVPSHEEYFGLVDNFIEDYEFEPKEEEDDDDEDIKKMIAIILALLQEFYILHMYDTEYYFASEQFEEDIAQFNSELKDNLKVLFTEFIDSIKSNLDAEWSIPSETVEFDIELEEVIDSSVNAVTDTLYSDLKDKADFYKLVAITTGTFSPHANFRRALKKLTNTVDYNGQYIRNRVNRAYQEFVYGQEALFYWVCSGRNTCAWCYEIEAMGAMPLAWFPVDHPNGMCRLVPENPNQYSDEYMDLIGGG